MRETAEGSYKWKHLLLQTYGRLLKEKIRTTNAITIYAEQTHKACRAAHLAAATHAKSQHFPSPGNEAASKTIKQEVILNALLPPFGDKYILHTVSLGQPPPSLSV